MLDSKTYQQELIRMWDSLRKDYKGENECEGVECRDCPLHDLECGCENVLSVVEVYNIVEKWSKEHPKHYYVSQLEYDIILVAIDHSLTETTFNDFDILGDLLEKGYFKGATLATNVGDYFNHCEVLDK